MVSVGIEREGGGSAGRSKGMLVGVVDMHGFIGEARV